jgi:hypothetical protein
LDIPFKDRPGIADEPSASDVTVVIDEADRAMEGIDLPDYVSICRRLVRSAGDPTRPAAVVLAEAGLTPERWARVRAAWSARLRADDELRHEYRRRFAAPEIE